MRDNSARLTNLLQSSFGTEGHDHHRLRRSAVNRYFSRASITKIEPKIQLLAQKLCNRIVEQLDSGKPFEVTMAYSCFATDIITNHCFGQSYGFLDHEDFEPNLRRAILGGCASMPIVRQFPILAFVIDSLPESVSRRMSSQRV
jgi:cytochrome P450